MPLADNYMIAVGELIKCNATKPDPAEGFVLIFDVDTQAERQVIIVDKRRYEIVYIGETESSVEIQINRRTP